MVAPPELVGGIAVRVAALCLDAHGRLPDRLLAAIDVEPGRSLDGWREEHRLRPAAVTAMAMAAALGDPDVGAAERPPAALIEATGPAASLCAAVVDSLVLADERYRTQAGALGAGPVGPF